MKEYLSNRILYHHGIKGQRWGIRRYQYLDGSLTPAGIARYRTARKEDSISKYLNQKTQILKESINEFRYRKNGKQYVDTFLKKGTTLSRIQNNDEFADFAFYATYIKEDTNKYVGLFGSNLKRRANRSASELEKKAEESKEENDIEAARKAREDADNMRIYQLKISATDKLKIPSNDNAAHILNNLLDDSDFRKNVKVSISDSKKKMIRPTQQVIFEQAENALKKDRATLTKSEKNAIYKAFNLSLVNHNPQEVAAQNRFYEELKKKGYSALLDYNDKEYSSYHAKRPVIIFDTNSVTLSSISEVDPKIISKMNTKYNAERLRKETTANTLGYLQKQMTKLTSEAYSSTHRFIEKHLNKR